MIDHDEQPLRNQDGHELAPVFLFFLEDGRPTIGWTDDMTPDQRMLLERWLVATKCDLVTPPDDEWQAFFDDPTKE